MAWQFEYTAQSEAAKERVWSRYIDVANWREWSVEGVEWSRLDGPFEVGTMGKSKPPGFPAGSFRLDVVVPERMFGSETKLPGARLRFEHIIQPVDAGVTITHRALIDGPLTWLWIRLLGRSIKRGLTPGVDRLATMAAADQ
jgi:hypothetical protein